MFSQCFFLLVVVPLPPRTMSVIGKSCRNEAGRSACKRSPRRSTAVGLLDYIKPWVEGAVDGDDSFHQFKELFARAEAEGDFEVDERHRTWVLKAVEYDRFFLLRWALENWHAVRGETETSRTRRINIVRTSPRQI